MSNWQHERDMSPEQYVYAFRRLGLDQAKTARVLGISERTSRRYVRGETEIPPAHALLLRAMVHYRVTPLVPEWQPEQN